MHSNCDNNINNDINIIESFLPLFFKRMRNTSFKFWRQRIWSFFGLKASSPKIFYLIISLLRFGLLLQCICFVILAILFLKGDRIVSWAIVYERLELFLTGLNYTILFQIICALPFIVLLLYFTQKLLLLQLGVQVEYIKLLLMVLHQLVMDLVQY